MPVYLAFYYIWEQRVTTESRNKIGQQFRGGGRLSDTEKMERCQRELEALKKIDSTVYSKRKAEFNKLISDASHYNGIRSDVGNYTQSVVEALYRFRSDKLCADIASDVLNKLSQEERN